MKPDEREKLNAYVDGELSATERRSVESQLEQRPELRAAVAELEALRDLFQKLPPQSLPGQFVDRVMASAERKMLLGEQALSTGSSQRKPWNYFRRRTWLVTALAASVVALLLIPAWYQQTTRLARAPSIAQSRDSVKELPKDTDHRLPEMANRAAAERTETLAAAPEQASAKRRGGEAIAAKSSAEVAEKAPVNQPLMSAGDAVAGREGKLIADLDSASDAAREEAGEERDARMGIPILAPRSDESTNGYVLAHDGPVAANEVLIEVQLAASSAGQPDLSSYASKQAVVTSDGKMDGTMDEITDQAGTKHGKDKGVPKQAGAAGADSLSRRSATFRAKDQAQIVAVETSLQQAGEILADLEQFGAVLRDYPLAPEFSRQLAEQFRANQAIASEQQAKASFDKSDVPRSVQLQVEEIVRARAHGNAEQAQPQTDVVIVNPNLPEGLDLTREESSADRSGGMQLTNRALSTALQAARRQQLGQANLQSELSDSQSLPEEGPPIQNGQQVRLYLWVREMPSGATKAVPQP